MIFTDKYIWPIDDLSTFKGYIQTDGYSGYTYLASLQNITHLSCWVHGVMYNDKNLKNDYESASHVMKLIQLLYAIESLVRESEMTQQERHTLSWAKSLPGFRTEKLLFCRFTRRSERYYHVL